MDATSPPPKSRYGLFSLPPELRNEIYAIVIHDDPNLWGFSNVGTAGMVVGRNGLLSPIRQVSRQMRQEWTSLFLAHSFLTPYFEDHRRGRSPMQNKIIDDNREMLAAFADSTFYAFRQFRVDCQDGSITISFDPSEREKEPLWDAVLGSGYMIVNVAGACVAQYQAIAEYLEEALRGRQPMYLTREDLRSLGTAFEELRGFRDFWRMAESCD